MAAGRSDRHAPPPFHAPRYGGLAMPRRLIAISLGLCLALLAVALPVGPAAGQDLVIAQGADITTLDPTQATQIRNLMPELAVSWKSVDPLTWQFKLRQGVKFHNGEPFNADAVKFTVDRLIT